MTSQRVTYYPVDLRVLFLTVRTEYRWLMWIVCGWILLLVPISRSHSMDLILSFVQIWWAWFHLFSGFPRSQKKSQKSWNLYIWFRRVCKVM